MRSVAKDVLVASLAIGMFTSLALVAFFFGGMFSPPGTNVQTIQLNRATLYSGPLPINPSCAATNNSYMTIILSNPKTITNISSVAITGSLLATSVNVYYLSATGTCTRLSLEHEPSVAGAGAITSLTLYLGGASPGATIQVNQTIHYVIDFTNGQSIAGSLLAQ